MMHNPKILFSDYFHVDRSLLNKYGAFNISLTTDLPLFVDPFLLFNSKNSYYKKLHDDIIKYLRFLKDKSIAQKVDKGLLAQWYHFKEVRQNWLGFSAKNNKGRGLGSDFAKALHENLYSVFSNFGNEQITKGSHLEKLCLIKDGVGRDNISDFTVNLIKDFLLKYTHKFARKHISKEFCKNVAVEKVRFNYKTESWESDTYYLPIFNNEYVLLTPKNILTKDENWINRTDLIEEFYQIPTAIPDESLRSQINNYFHSVLPQKPKEKDEKEAAWKTIQQFPVLIDYFIRYKEERGDLATHVSEEQVKYSERLYIEQFKKLVQILDEKTNFYGTPYDTYEEAKQRIDYFKQVIENNDGYKLFYINGQPIKTEDDLQILFRFVWFGTPSDISREVGDGRGSVDYKISRGAQDKTLVEFKLARNRQLRRNLLKQLEIYKKASQTDKGIYVILYFSEEEYKKVKKILNELELIGEESIILVDARADNKIPASKS